MMEGLGSLQNIDAILQSGITSMYLGNHARVFSASTKAFKNLLMTFEIPLVA